MSGRGVKRKRSCSEEPEEEAAEMMTAAAAEAEEVEVNDGVPLLAWGGPNAAHLQQRQLVMSLCLDKLQQRCQAGMELGLRRSVLLINTLRQIQEDMKRDGPGTVSVQLRPAAHPDTLVHSPDVSGSLPDVSGSLLDSPLGGDGDRDSYLLRDNVPLTCPGCTEGEKEGLSPLPSPPPHHPPLHQSPSGSPWSDSASSASSKPQTPAMRHPSNDAAAAANATGYYLGDDLAPDDVFEDIDTSMYDASDLPAAAWVGVGSYWPDSLSLWGDEELRMCSTDLNDLDHIMEILVNS